MAAILFENNTWTFPDNPTIGYIVGDGIGTDVTPAAMKVLDAAITQTYNGERSISWEEIVIGEKALEEKGDLMPKDELDKIKKLRVVLKGPLSTPIGKGFRSLNVAIRQICDLYSCIRPVKYFTGLPAPVKKPEAVDIVIFRENTEDVYAGIEWAAGSVEANKIIALAKEFGKNIRDGSAIGIKPVSKMGSQRLAKAALEYAIKNKRKSVTFVHKGNIMKYTEGAFKDWAYEIAEEYDDYVVLEEVLTGKTDKIVIKNRIADAMFQQLLLRPDEYDVIATMNLNGDYLSDAAAAQVGGLGVAPGANIGDGIAVFEATHGTAPKYAGLDKVNPGSIILSGVMLLQHLGWDEAADAIVTAFEKTVQEKVVTYDLARQMMGAQEVSCSGFAEAIIKNL